MDTEKKNAGRPNADVKKRSPFKILAVAVLAVFVVLLLAILAVPTLLSSSGGNRFLLGKSIVPSRDRWGWRHFRSGGSAA